MKETSNEKEAKNKIIKFSSYENFDKQILTENDINNLFFGFIKLIKKSVVIEKERQYKNEINHYIKELNYYMAELAKKNEEIEKLNNTIKKLQTQIKTGK